MTAEPPEADGKNLGIQALRICSILLVLIAHAGIGMPGEAGGDYWNAILHWAHPQVGVDLFFVISGYLVGKSLLSRAPSEPAPTVRAQWLLGYYGRRFWRLYPASFFWITFSLIAGSLLQARGFWLQPAELWRQWLASVALVRNFSESLRQTHLGYYWSLSAEWQFYLLVPLIWLLAPGRRFWSIALGYAAFCCVYRPGGAEWWAFRYDGMVWGLLLYQAERLGIVGAFARGGRGVWRSLWVDVALIGAMVGLPVALAPSLPPGDVFGLVMTSPFHNLAWTLVEILAAVVVARTIATPSSGVLRGMPGRCVDLGGELSYAIYLCHIPIWLLCKEAASAWQLRLASPMVAVLGLAPILIAAAATNYGVELPLKRFGKSMAA